MDARQRRSLAGLAAAAEARAFRGRRAEVARFLALLAEVRPRAAAA